MDPLPKRPAEGPAEGDGNPRPQPTQQTDLFQDSGDGSDNDDGGEAQTSQPTSAASKRAAADESDDSDTDENDNTTPQQQQQQNKNSNDSENDDEDDGNLPPPEHFAQAPNSLKGLRACMRCGLIKTFDQFYDMGCENCPFLDMFEEQEKVSKCTSAFFAGTCAVVDPSQSWMAKWLQIASAKPGLYAVDITGEWDQETRQMLESGNYNWRATAP